MTSPDKLVKEQVQTLREMLADYGKAPGRFSMERAALEAAIAALPARTEVEDVVLPCDVRVAPATTINAGCHLSTLLACIELRRDADAPYKFPPRQLPAPPAAEEGFVVVPVEPTEAMWAAAIKASCESEEVYNKDRSPDVWQKFGLRKNRIAHVFNAMLAARPQPAQGDGWLPIESAPRGGGAEYVTDPAWVDPPKLLVLCDDGTQSVAYWDWYYAEGGNGYTDGIAWVSDDAGEQLTRLHGKPTHWRPLPPPPAPADGGA